MKIRKTIDFKRNDRPGGVCQKLIGQEEDGPLVFFREKKSPPGKLKALLDAPRGEDRAGKLPVPGMENEIEVSLLRAGRKPVAGPGRWATTTTTGVSVMAARLTPSTIKANPPPEVPTMLGAPAKEAPMAMLIAAISSSACSTTRPILPA